MATKSIDLGVMYDTGNRGIPSEVGGERTIDPYFTINPDRVSREIRLCNLQKYLDGSIYNNLRYAFSKDYEYSRYIPMAMRRPSVTYRMCQIIVDNSVSLVFGESRFPKISVADDKATEEILLKLVKECHLDTCMLEAATKGSVGSAAILVKFDNYCACVQVLNTHNLEPIFENNEMCALKSLRRKLQVKGEVLIAKGHTDIESDKDYLLIQEWTKEQEIHYLPLRVDKIKNPKDVQLTKDNQRTITHGLGFVPIVWIKNINCNSDSIDGACTFEAAIGSQIEIDYQLSQAGRALKYSGDPLLIIKHGTSFISDIDASSSGMPVTMEDYNAEQAQIVRSAGNALELDAEGEAKLLEISGDAAKAVLEYVKEIRKYALESVHGNRADPDKLHIGQSGKALEILNQPLIWLAEKLRYTYGNIGLINVLKMIIKGSKKYPIVIDNERLNLKEDLRISLVWEDFYNETTQEKQQKANTLKTYKDAGLISTITATRAIANEFSIESVEDEMKQIETEKQQQLAQQASAGSQEKFIQTENI